MTRTLLRTLLALAPLAAGCAPLGYYVRAASGQWELGERSRPIAQVAADPDSPQWLRQKLEIVTALREFAETELMLPAEGAYRAYADLGRPYVVWNVFAAPEFSTRPREWCFPFAGCVTYRGYFSEEEANGFAAGLRRDGDDVHVAGVPAYSTLGWFDDPVLNTFVHFSDRDLARLLFHELAHRVAYVKDDSAFNESFATAVELEGVRRWLRATGRAGDEVELRRSVERGNDFRRLVSRWQSRLEGEYAADLPPEQRRERKRKTFAELRVAYEELRERWGGYRGYDGWFEGELNNARLASVVTYTEFVPAFEELLLRCEGDLGRFYAAVRALADVPGRDRRRALRDLLSQARPDAIGVLPDPPRPTP